MIWSIFWSFVPIFLASIWGRIIVILEVSVSERQAQKGIITKKLVFFLINATKWLVRKISAPTKYKIWHQRTQDVFYYLCSIISTDGWFSHYSLIWSEVNSINKHCNILFILYPCNLHHIHEAYLSCLHKYRK